MPANEMRIAQTKTLASDLFITVGSSLQVFPAATLPGLAKQGGAKLVIINNEKTPLDDIADIVIHQNIGDVFQGFMKGIDE